MQVDTDEVVGIATDIVYGSANEHDITRAREVIPDDTTIVYGDAGFLSMAKREEFQDLDQLEYMVACRPEHLKTMSEDSILRKNERFKAEVRTRFQTCQT